MLNIGRQSMGEFVDVFPDIEMKGKNQHETLDNLIKQTLSSESFLSFGEADKGSVQRFPWPDTIDQRSMNQHLDVRGKRQDPFENSISRNSLHSSVKGNNVFGKNSQSFGEKFHSFKIPEAVVAIVQATKGWPLLSNKMTMHKCEKCSQEFCSPLNLRRHMRAIHRRPFSGDKEDLKKKREQIAAYWNKLNSDDAREILSSDNLSVMDLSATLLIQALSTQLQKPGVSPPQSYVRAATVLLDLVQCKPSRFPISFDELYNILEDASEKNTFYGVTSSSMQRHIFDGEPVKVGLEAKNLVASLGFLVELRLVKVWTEDKDVEALKCQKALVEEEEAALEKRVKLQERKRQKKMRQKESKDKEKKSTESSSGLQEKLDSCSLGGSASASPRQSSPSPSCVSDTIVNAMELSEHLDGINFRDASGRINEDGLVYNADESADIYGQTGFCNEPVDMKRTENCAITGSLGWKERKFEGTRVSNFSKQVYGNDKRYYDNKYGGNQRLVRKAHNNMVTTAYDFINFNSQRFNRDQSFGMKKSTSTSGSGHAVWARKISKTKNPMQDVNTGSDLSAAVSDAILPLDLQHLPTDNDLCLAHSEKPGMLSQESSISLESINSNSSASISARVGIEEQDYSESACSSLMTAIDGHGALVIGSVMIPFAGDQSNGSSCGECEGNDAIGLERGGAAQVECIDDFVTKASLISTDFATMRSAHGSSMALGKSSSHNRLNFAHEGSTKVKIQDQSMKSGRMKIWRPVTSAVKASACNETSSQMEFLEDQCPVDSIQSSTDIGKSEWRPNISLQEEMHHKEVSAHEKSSDDNKHPPTLAVMSSYLPSCYSDISNLLCQRWAEATSSSDVVFHCDLDDVYSSVSSII